MWPNFHQTSFNLHTHCFWPFKYHALEKMPLKSTHLIIFHSKSTHYKIIPLISTHLRKCLLSESLFGVLCFSDSTTQARITLAHLSSPPTNYITLTKSRFLTLAHLSSPLTRNIHLTTRCVPPTHKISHLAIFPTVITPTIRCHPGRTPAILW